METILVTGAAGFIGFHFARRLLDENYRVAAVDNLTPYYSVELKKDRLAQLTSRKGFEFEPLDLADRAGIDRFFDRHRPTRVVHLAAQAGVRYSLENPHAYINANLAGFMNILESCRHRNMQHLVYASSSSVYGSNTKLPFSVRDSVDHPVSLYAATKKANELMAHSYSHLFGLPTTGLRFFTVYGPWGRPDMAMYQFAKAILADQPINLFNQGNMRRDFTYVDDIVEGVYRVMKRTPEPDPGWDSSQPDPSSSKAPYRVYNIGNNHPVELLYVVEVLEKCLGKKAKRNLMPMQPGDVPATYADIDDLERDVGFRPVTPIEEGVRRFVEWYREYHAT